MDATDGSLAAVADLFQPPEQAPEPVTCSGLGIGNGPKAQRAVEAPGQTHSQVPAEANAALPMVPCFWVLVLPQPWRWDVTFGNSQTTPSAELG